MMGVTTFDTLKFVRRLEKVGVPSEQAEVQAEVLTEAFKVNLEELVTKEYLTAEFAKQNERFAQVYSHIDTRFAEERAHTDKQFADMNANFKILRWMIGFAVLLFLVPQWEQFASLL